MLATVGMEKRIMLFGIKHNQVEAKFAWQSLTTVDAILIESDLTVSALLTHLDLTGNCWDPKEMVGIPITEITSAICLAPLSPSSFQLRSMLVSEALKEIPATMCLTLSAANLL